MAEGMSPEELGMVEPIETGGERRTMQLNFGPQHPSTHGVFRAVLTLDGETVVDVDPVLGYLHRNHDYIYQLMTYPQIVPMTDRTDYLSPLNNELVYSMAVEELLGIEVPERAQYLRVIFAELNRILSHFLYIGSIALDLAGYQPFLLSWRERELGYDLIEKATGQRMFPNYIRIGGVHNDVPEGWTGELLEFLDFIEREAWPEYKTLWMENPIFKARSEGVGVLPGEVAIAYGATGPVARASGVRRDLRKDRPYLVYDRFDFEMVTGEKGDTYERSWMRMYEILESIKIIRQAVRDMPDGPILGQLPRGPMKAAKGAEVFTVAEGPRGEHGVYIASDGGVHPYRIHWFSPTFTMLQLLPYLAKGLKVADLIAILASLDPVMGEVDR
ncbi:MAG: NADH-quinone oxidoreductase subunit D [Bacillota bacterium]|nr:NADH-quinone oxidoreductase subunit D [Bacillota bacterium]